MNEISANFCLLTSCSAHLGYRVAGYGPIEILGKFTNPWDIPAGLYKWKIRPQMKSNRQSNKQNPRDSCFSDSMYDFRQVAQCQRILVLEMRQKRGKTGENLENWGFLKLTPPTPTVRDHNNVLNHYAWYLV